ncbi:DUF1125 domain-containing protein [Lactococcus lactis]
MKNASELIAILEDTKND